MDSKIRLEQPRGKKVGGQRKLEPKSYLEIGVVLPVCVLTLSLWNEIFRHALPPWSGYA